MSESTKNVHDVTSLKEEKVRTPIRTRIKQFPSNHPRTTAFVAGAAGTFAALAILAKKSAPSDTPEQETYVDAHADHDTAVA